METISPKADKCTPPKINLTCKKTTTMSYGAYVICNCFQEGKTTEPPHKEFLKFDDEGLCLDIPKKLWKKGTKKVYQMLTDFDEWKRTACKHEEMELANEYLANITGMGAFRQIVRKLGGKNKFPILTKYLPKANGGILPAEFAQQAFDELLLLENEQTTEEKVVLLEKSTGSLKASVSSDTYFFFLFSKNKNIYGIDKEGFFILEKAKKKGEELFYIMFRSNSFIQQKISKSLYKFIDIPSGESYECSSNIDSNQEETTGDYEFEIKKQNVAIRIEYQYIIEPLKLLSKASILSGNPIHWT